MTDSLLATKTLVMHIADTKGFAVDIRNWLEAGETAASVGSVIVRNAMTGLVSTDITISGLAVNTSSIINDEGDTVPAYESLSFTATGNNVGAGNTLLVTTPFTTSLSEVENPVLAIVLSDGRQ